MSEAPRQMPGVTCPLCGKAAERVHTQRFKEALPLYQGPIPAHFGSIAEGGPFGARRAISASGKELAVGDMEDVIHCPACKVIVFRYEE